VTPDGERMQEVRDEAAPRTGAPLPAGWDEAVRLEEDPAVVPDPASVEVPSDLRREIVEHMAKYPDRHSAALPALAAAQKRHGWCSPEAITQVAAVMQVTPAYLSSVVTFYDMLRAEPTGSHYLYVCTSVACHVRNAKAVFDAVWEEARDQGLEDWEVREFECLGACDMAPMASVDGRYVGPLDTSDAHELVAAAREGRAVLPGRGLEDSDYEVPPATDEGRSGEPPSHPDVDPAGGTVKDRDDLSGAPGEGDPPELGDRQLGAPETPPAQRPGEVAAQPDEEDEAE
jgi:NADH:ubiquinone oxidoreductase subunit E